MDLNIQLTNRTKLLILVLGIVLIIAIVTQWGSGLYKLVSNPEMKSKQQVLQSTKNLVTASELLKPVETSLYQRAGLSNAEQNNNIFEGDFPGTVVRKRIHEIIKEAGISGNYQLNMEPVPGKKPEKISTQARDNLVVLLYQKTLESERDTFSTETEDTNQDETYAEEEAMDMLMNAWLVEEDDEDETSKKTEEGGTDAQKDDNPVEEDNSERSKESEEVYNNQTESDTLEDNTLQWEFVSLPDSIPSSMKIELIDLILSMVEQHLVGASNQLFENQFYEIQTAATAGFFGIGAKKPTKEINFHPNSEILTKLSNLINYSGEELNPAQITADLLVYLEQIQTQIADLSQKLQLAPTSYTPDSYNVKIKFKAELDRLVKLNQLIESKTKWLMVRDLQVAADKDNKINVDVFMIARVYQ